MLLNPRTRITLVGAALVVLILGIYWPAWHFEFLNYDDPDYVTENTIVQRGVTPEGLKWAFGRLHGERTYWHPVTWISHMIDCQLFGLNPVWHHGMNVLFHGVNSILLLTVLSTLSGAFWRSAAVATVFAIHPLQVETVAWVTERKNLLSGLFWLLTLAAYIKFTRTKKTRAYLLSLALFACALMSKPAVVTLPFVFLLLDLWPLKRFPRKNSTGKHTRSGKWLLLEKLPFVALSAVSAIITVLGHEGLGLKATGAELPLIHRVQNALVSYGQYLKKMFLPFDLAIPYPHPGSWPSDIVIMSSLVLLLLTVAILAQVRTRPYLAVGWLWFLGVLVPAIGIVQVGYQAMADRFVYIPIIGVLMAVVWSAADFLQSSRAKPPVIGGVIVAMVAYFAISTTYQLRHWKDSEALFRRAVAATQRNFIAHVNLSAALLTKAKLDEAEFHARRAVEIHSKDHLPFLLLGRIYQQQTNFPAAVSHYREALALNPDATEVRYRLASALFNAGQFPEAKEQFETLTSSATYKAEAHAGLGEIFTVNKNAAAAVQHYREALAVRPNWPVILNNLAWLRATTPDPQLRDGAEAVRLAERACELSRYEEPLFIGTLAAAYAEAGRFEDAVATAKRAQALALQKNLPDLAARNAELINLYQAGQPVRAP